MEIKRIKFNISLLGEKDVGKTSLISVFNGGTFSTKTISTIGIDNFAFNEKIDGKYYMFKVFDTAGQERYRSVSNSTIRVADGFLLIFSVENRNSFEILNDWLDTISQQCDINSKVIFLVGNKIDVEKREVSNEEAVIFAKSRNLLYYETSAKSGFGIKDTFQKLFYSVYEKCKELDKNESDENNNNDNNRQNIKLDKNHLKKSDKKNCSC